MCTSRPLSPPWTWASSPLPRGTCKRSLLSFRVSFSFINSVNSKITESKRVWRLAGLLQESYGESDWAEESYRENVKTDASDAASIKRIISLYKHQGKLAECVQELNAYLAIYQCDAESWWELAEIYLGENEYEKAAFCFEELIIINPHNPLVHQVSCVLNEVQVKTQKSGMQRQRRPLAVSKI